jgi:RPA family protein
MSDDGPGAREVAHRVFAAEFDDASLSYSESDEERAPNYVVTPTGARVNRLFVAGVLTEVERVNDETRRGRVVDPSGAFVTYAGQYQPEAQAFVERADPPSFVALTGKARTFEPEDSDRVFTSVRPESLNEVDADTRDRWVVSAAEATLDRLAVFAAALDSDLRGDELRVALESGGAPASLAAGIPKAIAHYDTSTAYVEAVRGLAVDALELIAGDRDELPETDVRIEAPTGAAEPSEVDESAGETETGPTAEVEAEATGDTEAEATADSETEATADSEAGATAAVDAGGESGSVESGETAGDTSGTETTDAADGSATGETAESQTADTVGSDATDDDGGSAVETDETGGLGDFETGGEGGKPGSADEALDVGDGTGDATASTDSEDVDPASDEMYELDEEEREEIESEFGTDFATGSEVDEPGEADIDVPDPEELQETPEDAAAADLDADPVESAGAGGETDGPDAGGVTDGPDAGDAPDVGGGSDDIGGGSDGDDGGDEAAARELESAVVDAMGALDDGDGADREAVVDRVAAEHGVADDAVEDAIQDALMSGKCYEPGDGVLKPI